MNEPQRIDTRIGGVLVLSKGEANCAVLVERHALVPLTPGWAATYYGPGDVEGERIKLAASPPSC